MEKRKRNILISALAVILISTAILCIASWRHTYTADDKYVDRNYTGVRMHSPGIELSTGLADIVIEGKIVSKGSDIFIKLWSDDPTVKVPDGVGFGYTIYKIQIKEVWFGEYSDRMIPVYFPNSGPVPKINDRIITFLSLHNSPEKGEYYRPVDKEYSSFIVNPDGTLFSFAKAEESAKYDGELPSELKTDVAAKIAELAADKKIIGGEVLKKYREENKTP